MCVCTDTNGTPDYCGRWDESEFDWCYLRGKENSKHCPGATIGKGGYYWSKDQGLCEFNKKSKCLIYRKFPNVSPLNIDSLRI